MLISAPPLLLLAALLPLASATRQRLQRGYAPSDGGLVPRAGCKTESTWYCDANVDDCCDIVGGPGFAGDDNEVIQSATIAPSLTVTEHGAGSKITCLPSMNGPNNDGLACCKLYDETWSYCPKFNGCYAPDAQECCTSGNICIGEGCCKRDGSSATTPYPSGAEQTSGAGDAGTSGSMTTAGTGGEKTGVSTTGVSTSTPSGAAVTNALGGAMVVAVGVLGVAML
ncbi:hypothetical protein V490_09334 [Pseudogymnoascus sp. VKM F-3557]|nr:hypothetical protein V490_09334 [Pseudogymnoascus sp. VKM F-3557]